MQSNECIKTLNRRWQKVPPSRLARPLLQRLQRLHQEGQAVQEEAQPVEEQFGIEDLWRVKFQCLQRGTVRREQFIGTKTK